MSVTDYAVKFIDGASSFPAHYIIDDWNPATSFKSPTKQTALCQ